MKPAAPDPELIEWLWSAEGCLWHQKSIKRVAHAQGTFAEVKDDHTCDPEACKPQTYRPHPDSFIFHDLREYGISGVPEEWKRR